MRSVAAWLSVAGLLVLGCGGGGGGGGVSDDASAPRAAVALDGRQDVEVGREIVVTFSEWVDRSRLQATLKVNGQVIAGDPVFHEENGAWTLTFPRPHVVAPASAELVVSGIVDAQGNASEPQTFRWTYPAWLPMGVPAGGAATNLGVGADGPVLVWSGAGGVHSGRWTGTGWTEGPLAAGSAASSVAFDDGGAPVILQPDSGGHLQVLRLDAGGWTTVGAAATSGTLSSEGGAAWVAYAAPHTDTICLVPSTTSCNQYQMGHNAYLRASRVSATPFSSDLDLGLSDPTLVAMGGDASGLLVALSTGEVKHLQSGGGWSSLGSPGGSVSRLGAIGGAPVAIAGGSVKRYASGGWQALGTTDSVVSLRTSGKNPVIVRRAVSGSTAAVQVLEFDPVTLGWAPLGAEVTGPVDAQGISAVEDASGNVYRASNGSVARFNR